MPDYLGQFVYLGKAPWYGARLAMQALGEQVRPASPRYVTSAWRDKALFLSLLSAREFPELFAVLERAKLPLYNGIRGEADALVIAGGGACFNPEPVADLVDVFCVGDGEAWFPELGRCLSYPTRQMRLDALAELPGAYLPGRRKFAYEGGIFVKDVQGEQAPVIPAATETLPPPPDEVPIRGSSELELARGCRGGCRFCLLAWTVPYRERPQEEALALMRERPYVIRCPNAGGVSYYRVAKALSQHGPMDDVGEMRVDDFVRLPFPKPHEYRGRRLTFGVEGITPRLRRLLGKPIPPEMLAEALTRVINGDPAYLRLYFIRNVPTEGGVDWREFLDWLLHEVYPWFWREQIALQLQFTPLTRTPHTPLQWVAHRYNREAEAHVKDLVDYARALKAEDPEALLYVTPSRREASWLIETALTCGSRQALQFVYNLHRGACSSLGQDTAIGRGVRAVEGLLRDCGIDPDLLLADWDPGAVLPWSHIQPLGEAGADRRLRSYRAFLRQVAGPAGIAG